MFFARQRIEFPTSYDSEINGSLSIALWCPEKYFMDYLEFIVTLKRKLLYLNKVRNSIMHNGQQPR